MSSGSRPALLRIFPGDIFYMTELGFRASVRANQSVNKHLRCLADLSADIVLSLGNLYERSACAKKPGDDDGVIALDQASELPPKELRQVVSNFFFHGFLGWPK